MNILPIILLFAIMSGKGEALPPQMLSSVLSMAGLNGRLGEALSSVMQGGLTPQKLLPLLIGGGKNLLPTAAAENAFDGNPHEANGTRKPSSNEEIGVQNRLSSVGNDCVEEYGLDEISPFSHKNAGAEQNCSAPNYLKPITDFADERINYALAHYFANN